MALQALNQIVLAMIGDGSNTVFSVPIASLTFSAGSGFGAISSFQPPVLIAIQPVSIGETVLTGTAVVLDGELVITFSSAPPANVAFNLTITMYFDSGMSFSAQQVSSDLFPETFDKAYAYLTGVSGTAAVPAGGLVVGMAAHASNPGATVTINGGPAIPVPMNVGLSSSPSGRLVAPTYVFSGTDAYLVEFVL